AILILTNNRLTRKKMEANGTGLKGFQDKLLVNFINSLHEIFKMRIAGINQPNRNWSFLALTD
ncbi:hypothetical protein, partial [Mastigocoleus sp. MO_188.B34]|uniref:hypothetical protein n=1 Tax=Mastigocoleus sp. MO_188.B34 TaxID=3036635 RepID=UPI002610BC4D